MDIKIISTEARNVQNKQTKSEQATVQTTEPFTNVLNAYLLAASTKDSMDSVSVELPAKNAHTLRTLLGSIQLQEPKEASNVQYALHAYGALQSTPLTSPNNAQQIARNITSLYEGGGIAGNFDGQGLSLGYLQWNIGSNTLQPLLRDMANNPETKIEFDRLFSGTIEMKDNNGKITSTSMGDEIRQMLLMDPSQQFEWAKSINTSQNKIKEPWKSAFNQLLQSSAFKSIQDKYALPYFNKANKIVNDENIGVKTVRGYTLAFDITVQNGSIKSSAYNLILDAMAGKNNKLTNPNDTSLSKNQREVILDLQNRIKNSSDPDTRKLYYTAAAVAISAKDNYAKDVWLRKSTIVSGTGRVHGQNLALNNIGLSDERLT